MGIDTNTHAEILQVPTTPSQLSALKKALTTGALVTALTLATPAHADVAPEAAPIQSATPATTLVVPAATPAVTVGAPTVGITTPAMTPVSTPSSGAVTVGAAPIQSATPATTLVVPAATPAVTVGAPTVGITTPAMTPVSTPSSGAVTGATQSTISDAPAIPVLTNPTTTLKPIPHFRPEMIKILSDDQIDPVTKALIEKNPDMVLGEQVAPDCKSEKYVWVADKDLKIQITLNGLPTEMIVIRNETNKKVKFILSENFYRREIAGTCMAIGNGEVYPDVPTGAKGPEGDIIRKRNPYGDIIGGISTIKIDPTTGEKKTITEGGGYASVTRQMAESINNGIETGNITTAETAIRANMNRFGNIILQDPLLLTSDAREGYVATLAQLQLDLTRVPVYYNSDETGKKIGNHFVAFINQHIDDTWVPQEKKAEYKDLSQKVIRLIEAK